MPRQKKPRYVHPSKRGEDFDPETTITGLRGDVDPFKDLPEDGCRFDHMTEGARHLGQPVLFPLGADKFYPELKGDLPLIFESKFLKPSQGGGKWSTLPAWVVAYYFDELRKKYYMPNKLQARTWKVFNAYCSLLYKSKVHHLHKKGKRPDYIDEDAWVEWIDYWKNDPDFNAQSEQNTINRNKEKTDTDGSSRHFCGSKSTAVSALEAEFALQPKCLWDIFNDCKCKKGGDYPDDRARSIAADYLRGLPALGENPDQEAKDQLFLKVNPPDQYGYIYGIGSHSHRLQIVLPDAGSVCGSSSQAAGPTHSSRVPTEYLLAESEREALLQRQRELEEELAANRAQVAATQAEVAATQAKQAKMEALLLRMAERSGMDPDM